MGHPLKESEEDCEELGVRMKRNNVAIDIINFAHPENVPKLQALVRAANSNNNSHMLDVPMGVSMITDVLIASPIINEGMDEMPGGQAAAAGGMPAQSQFADYGGIDPNLDPELAMALRISMEEERARQVQPPAAVQQPEAAPVEAPIAPVEEALDEDEILQRALMLSVAEGAAEAKPKEPEQPAQQNINELL